MLLLAIVKRLSPGLFNFQQCACKMRSCFGGSAVLASPPKQADLQRA
ncbi:MAG: hypothetical protein OFPII_20900 [Osedax symbiont Rs1]|nr:MAG: hypothetical protein OFPII_20900 [Osedax symbiont Rs1]